MADMSEIAGLLPEEIEGVSTVGILERRGLGHRRHNPPQPWHHEVYHLATGLPVASLTAWGALILCSNARPVDTAPARPVSVDLTPVGEQFVIPGCERDQARGPDQRSLW